MIKHMLAVLMDGIKNAEMLIDYAASEKEIEEDEYCTWLKNMQR